jgi:hypothetical protein
MIKAGQVAKKPMTLVLLNCCPNLCENLIFLDFDISLSPLWRVHGHVSAGARGHDYYTTSSISPCGLRLMVYYRMQLT